MGAEEQRVVRQAAVWLINVLSAVALLFVQRALMRDYAFNWAATTSGLQLIAVSLVLTAAQQLSRLLGADGGGDGSGRKGVGEQQGQQGQQGGGLQKPSLPTKHLVVFSALGAVSITTAKYITAANNSLGFYTLAKLTLVPTTCWLEAVLLSRSFSLQLMACIATALLGVGVITVTDISISLPDLIMGALFVASTSGQQVMCGRLQAMHKLRPHQLLLPTATAQGSLLLVAGPFLDKLFTGKWVTSWEVNVPGIEMLATSCVLAVAVILTQFMILGEHSASSYQVYGLSKTLLVVLTGWVLFSELVNSRELVGIVIALVGMAAYGAVCARQGREERVVKSPFHQAPPASGQAGQPGKP